MRVLMLGWEYPPHISGGLGVACEGLTKGLSRLGVSIDFVMPFLTGQEQAPHMRIWDSKQKPSPRPNATIKGGEALVRTWKIPASLHPYMTPGNTEILTTLSWEQMPMGTSMPTEQGVGRYGRDLFREVSQFTRTVFEVAMGLEFDLIHAHDWMTFPAALLLAKATQKPLLVHIHSLEQDRSGNLGGNERIKAIEYSGLAQSTAALAVSFYTRSRIQEFYGISPEKVYVVHNGVYTKEEVRSHREKGRWPGKVVLFLGRITYQKGPDYFVEAAAKVIEHVSDVTFVMAGTGDMLPQVKARVRELGLERYFEFSGFLMGEDVERIFSVADVYVMPSVSEPFGITALEALSQETPILVSKQSGVSEVLNHALKADFWDTDQLANLIVGALQYPELREDMLSMARQELKRLHWDAAANKVLNIYQIMIGAH